MRPSRHRSSSNPVASGFAKEQSRPALLLVVLSDSERLGGNTIVRAETSQGRGVHRRSCFARWLLHNPRGLSGGSPDDGCMTQRFVSCDREQVLLMPVSLREWLPENHLA